MAIKNYFWEKLYRASYFAYQYYFLQEHIALLAIAAICKFS
jgi:hypothetical protein